ncbi:alpha-2-macroglobulin family protein [Candidatus Magnetoovum chiemensis]|nr:alpha-2-macroglobulin family protein [Candidatus Magnetoovum chiemensis]
MVDLGKPAFKLGLAEILVGWKANELKVDVETDKKVYKIRDKAKLKIKVTAPNGRAPKNSSEIAVSVVDQGLLELAQNDSWDILRSMMSLRPYEVYTSTSQLQVVGKRHYGLKALPHGGGGGRFVTRELFDTLLLWNGRVNLDDNGCAEVEIPINDSLTEFKAAVVANAETAVFGSGYSNFTTTQDLMIMSGLSEIIREGDKYNGEFTIRNTTQNPMEVELTGSITTDNGTVSLERKLLELPKTSAKTTKWDFQAPTNQGKSLKWQINAKDTKNGTTDAIAVKQRIAPLVSPRVYQATLMQLDKPINMDVERPENALADKGGINVSIIPTIADDVTSIIAFMKDYPYICMEQKVSKAISLNNKTMWENIMKELPSYFDSLGLVKYFPTSTEGSDVLTSYILSISNEAGFEIPENLRYKMENALIMFVEGKIAGYSPYHVPDLTLRKVSALEALSRYGKATPALVSSISVETDFWPTSTVIDWINVLLRVKDAPNNDKMLTHASQTLRSRLNFQGTSLHFSTEDRDSLWWLMVCNDVNAVKTLLTAMNLDDWQEDIGRIVKGTMNLRKKGIWQTTVANTWGIVTLKKFKAKYEAKHVTGITTALLDDIEKTINWHQSKEGAEVLFNWPSAITPLSISHAGDGAPWATIQSLAAIPLTEPYSTGYKITKTITPVTVKEAGKFSKGDVIKIKLQISAQADMAWVVVNDPIPAGSIALGSGLGKDSAILSQRDYNNNWNVYPVFEERSFEAFRAYYSFVPKGSLYVEYNLRLNNDGEFNLPQTRVEALYAPEMFGEIPNKNFVILNSE